MRLTISVNGRFLARRMTGVDRFAFEVMLAIDKLISAQDPDFRDLSFRLLVPGEIEALPSFRNIEIKRIGGHRGHLWEQFELHRHIGAKDVLLSLCNTGPAFLRRQIVVIHDAATARVPAAFTRGFRSWYRILLPLLGAASRKVVTVSRFSQDEIVDAFSIRRQKTVVVSEGAEHLLRIEPDNDALKKFNLHSRPYVLAVSSMAAHKNFKLVLDALSTLPDAPFDVAIAGGANPAVFGQGAMSNSQRVRWLGYVSDAELRALYESAMCFVFPSVYEGFGIPPLEAMHCGCPVLAAKAASIPEVCGDAAEYFSPHDATALGSLLLRIAEDAQLRRDMSARGRLRAKEFTWERTARQMAGVCREAMQ